MEISMMKAHIPTISLTNKKKDYYHCNVLRTTLQSFPQHLRISVTARHL